MHDVPVTRLLLVRLRAGADRVLKMRRTGYTFRGTIENFVAGFIILLFRPFKVSPPISEEIGRGGVLAARAAEPACACRWMPACSSPSVPSGSAPIYRYMSSSAVDAPHTSESRWPADTRAARGARWSPALAPLWPRWPGPSPGAAARPYDYPPAC